ncbi:ATP-binding protein [Tateyamaria sp.]|nr:ATP-binding protein [Tateyamaria sp.]
MQSELKGYRVLVLAGLLLLGLLFSLMVSKLFSELKELSVADSGNSSHWNYYQFDTEFANLELTLAEHIAYRDLPIDEVRLRADIVFSNILLMESGRIGEIVWENKNAQVLFEPVRQFAMNAIDILDRSDEIELSDLLILRDMIKDVHPTVHEFALFVFKLEESAALERRDKFSKQLRWTGGFAIILLFMMAGLLLLLDIMLRTAMQRDTDLSAAAVQLASTVAGSSDAILTADSYGKIIEYNASAEGLFGWTREEVIGKTMEEIIFPKGISSAYKNAMNRALEIDEQKAEGNSRVELSALQKSGEEFFVELSMTFVERNGRAIFMAYIRDISDRKLIEQTLINARDQAERTDKAKSQFLTVMSHEMRTPLAGIIGVMDLLKTTKLTKKQDHYRQIVTSSSEVLLEHINEALDITRIEGGELQFSIQSFSLTTLATSLIAVLEPLAVEKKLDLTLQIDKNVRFDFMGDVNRIRQILTNLVGNSIKFTDDGYIRLEISGTDHAGISYLQFKITDTGVGIAPENQKKIFDDFVTLSFIDGRQMRGDGLGLSISRKIARLMSGDIEVKSDVGKGAVFTLTIPLQRIDEIENRVIIHPDFPEVRVNPINVLIVEDNDINRKVLCDMLMVHGHTVSTATDGLEALEQAGNQVFDVIFMDISMPIMGGLEATSRLRAGDGLNAKTYIVGLSAHGSEEFREQAEEAGMDWFHTKPIRMNALHKIIANIRSAPELATFDESSSPVLQELRAAIGREKVLSVGAKFFNELDIFIQQSIDGELLRDYTILAEAIHKMRGAAALLGQERLEKPLAKLEKNACDGDVTDWSNDIQNLQDVAQRSKVDFHSFLRES